MVVTCHACQTKFRVDDSKIGARGVKVRCSKCQTMIIVKPETAPPEEAKTQEMEVPKPPPPPADAAMPPIPSFDDDDDAREPTKVMQAPLMTQMLQQAAKEAEGRDPFDLTPTPMPANPQPPPMAAQTKGPPPIGPPPMKPQPPGLDMAIGTEKPAGTWQTAQPPAQPPPPSAQPQASSPEPLGDDLFSDPFAVQPPSQPKAEDSQQQRFADLQPSGGPALELDVRPKNDAPADDPLAGMPKFEDPPDEGPQFEGGMSAEGTVTKPTALADLKPSSRPQHDERPIATARDKQPSQPVMQAVATKRGPSRKTVAVVGYVAIVMIVIAGLFGEYMLFRAGGYEGLLGAADRLSAPAGIGVDLGRVNVAPYQSASGKAFVIVRGELRNKNAAASAPFTIDVTLGGKKVASVGPGSSIDAAALYKDDRIEATLGKPTLEPNETASFAVAILAPPDASIVQDGLMFAVSPK